MTKIHTSVHQTIQKKTAHNDLIVMTYAHADYEQTHTTMLARTLERIEQKKQGVSTSDELWLVEHKDVYTLGQAGKREHILMTTDTPVIKTDRGGQVTWHGKGQLVAYWLFDLERLGWGVRNMVSHAEQCVEDVLNARLKKGLQAHARQDAPGVYVYHGNFDAQNPTHNMLGKIASLGFKIKHGFSYHGLALNIHSDLSVFDAINPCGYQGMPMLNVQDVVDSQHAISNNEPLFELPIIGAIIDNLEQRRLGRVTLR